MEIFNKYEEAFCKFYYDRDDAFLYMKTKDNHTTEQFKELFQKTAREIDEGKSSFVVFRTDMIDMRIASEHPRLIHTRNTDNLLIVFSIVDDVLFIKHLIRISVEYYVIVQCISELVKHYQLKKAVLHGNNTYNAWDTGCVLHGLCFGQIIDKGKYRCVEEHSRGKYLNDSYYERSFM